MEAIAGVETSIPTLSISEDDGRDPYDVPVNFGERPSQYFNRSCIFNNDRCRWVAAVLRVIRLPRSKPIYLYNRGNIAYRLYVAVESEHN